MPPLIVSGLEFDLPTTYSEGHKCTAAEATELEALRRSRIASNFTKQIEKELSANGGGHGTDLPDFVKLRLGHEFATYSREYVLGAKSSDPIVREAQRLAGDLAAEELRKRGKKRSDVDDATWKAAVARLAASPAVLAEARTRVEASRKILSEALDLDL